MSQAARQQATLRAVPSAPQRTPRAPAAMPSTLAAKRHAQQAEQHEVLVREFGLVASAPNGIAKLRGLILDLALCGKLLPQNEKDEPAENIKAKILEQMPPKNAGKQEKREYIPVAELPSLPANWAWSSLGELTQINPRNVVADNTEVSFIPMTLIGKDYEGSHAQETELWGNVKQGFTHFAEGDVGIAKITPCFENGKACIFSGLKNGVGAGTTELHIVRISSRLLLPRYVLLFLKSAHFLENGRRHMTGTAGQKRLPKDFLADYPFPLAPHEEQQRIVKQVDDLMALCDRMEAQQADAEAAHKTLVKTLLNALTQSQDSDDFNASWQCISENFELLFSTDTSINFLEEAIVSLAVLGKLAGKNNFGKSIPVSMGNIKNACSLYSLPQGWRWISLNELASEISTGPFGSMLHQEDYIEDGVPIINPSHMIKGEIVPDKRITISKEKAKELASYVLSDGDIVMARRGEMGRAALVREEAAGWLCGTGSFILKFNGEVDRQFIMLLMKSRYVRSYLNEQSVGTTMTNLNHKILKQMPIPLPPFEEQHRIVAKVDELMALCDVLKARLARADTFHEHLADALVKQGAAS